MNHAAQYYTHYKFEKYRLWLRVRDFAAVHIQLQSVALNGDVASVCFIL